MNINLQISQTSITEDFIVKAYEVAIDGTLSEVDSITVPAPHSAPEWVAFTGLDKVTHNIKVIGVTSSIIYNSYEKTPSVDTVTIYDYIQFKIGDGGTYTPAIGDSAYVNPNMIGFDPEDYIVLRTGYGVLFEGVHIDNEPTGGGFTFHTVGDTFSDGEEFTIIPKPVAVSTPVNDSVVGKQWGPTQASANMYLDVTSSVTYVPAHLRKLIRLAGSSAVYTFASSDVPPVGYIFRVTNYGSPGVTTPNPKVVFSNAPAKYGSGTITELSIPFGNVCEFVWDGTIWNITMTVPPVINMPTFYKGSYTVGDVPVSSTVTISGFPTQTDTGYWVGISLVSAGTAGNDNTLTWQLIESTKTTTTFQVILGEITSRVQNVKISYIIINF